jgi:hypothetical protein
MMPLKFNVYASDGNSKKTFKDMAAAEQQFGTGIAHSDVSNDGVVRISPANKETEEALRHYREIKQLGKVYSPEVLSLPLTEGIRARLSNENPVSDGKGTFYLRGDDYIAHALVALCGAEPGEGVSCITRAQCKENVSVTYDESAKVMVVIDALGTAKALNDLALRSLVKVGSLKFDATTVNEDTNVYTEHYLGYSVGDEAHMAKVYNGTLDVGMGGADVDVTFNGFVNSKELTTLLLSLNKKEFNMLPFKTTEFENDEGKVISLDVVTPAFAEYAHSNPEKGVWVEDYRVGVKGGEFKTTSEIVLLNIGDAIDYESGAVIKKEDLNEKYKPVSPDNPRSLQHGIPF